jgi:hypothetical protein
LIKNDFSFICTENHNLLFRIDFIRHIWFLFFL